jgi:hypothetical protein
MTVHVKSTGKQPTKKSWKQSTVPIWLTLQIDSNTTIVNDQYRTFTNRYNSQTQKSNNKQELNETTASEKNNN